MGIAQKLYEAGHITYMRTDSTNLSKIAVAEIVTVIEKEYGKEYVQHHTFSAKSKNAQEAHEAIRPTHASIKKAGKNGSEEEEKTEKRKNGKGGIWRLPPSFDGSTRAPLPRFTALNEKERSLLKEFFVEYLLGHSTLCILYQQ